jgi:hypothetical protein
VRRGRAAAGAAGGLHCRRFAGRREGNRFAGDAELDARGRAEHLGGGVIEDALEVALDPELMDRVRHREEQAVAFLDTCPRAGEAAAEVVLAKFTAQDLADLLPAGGL